MKLVKLIKEIRPELSNNQIRSLIKQGAITVYWTDPQYIATKCKHVPEEDIEIIKDVNYESSETPALIKIGHRRFLFRIMNNACDLKLKSSNNDEEVFKVV